RPRRRRRPRGSDFKTGLSLLVGDGRFDSFPSPPSPFVPARQDWLHRNPKNLSEISEGRELLLTEPRRRFTDDEVPERHPERLARNVFGWDAQEVKGTLLLVTECLGLQHLLPALRARHDERHGRQLV